MRTTLILIVQLFPLFIFSQIENNKNIQNSEMASYFNSYDIIKEIKDTTVFYIPRPNDFNSKDTIKVIKEEFNLKVEELKQKKVEVAEGYEWTFDIDDFESNKNNFNFNKVWVKKEIGYLSEFIKQYGISNWNDMKLKFSELEKENKVISSYYENLPHGYWDFGNYKGEFKNGKQEGEWIYFKIESNPCFFKDCGGDWESYSQEKIDTSIVHEFYKNGIADGQWFRIKNNIKQNTFNFINGKLDGEINIFGQSDAKIIFGSDYQIPEINMNFSNGIPNGNFTLSCPGETRKGCYSLGIPIGKWEVTDIFEDSRTFPPSYKFYKKYSMEIDEQYSTIKIGRYYKEYEKVYYVSNKNDVFKQYDWLDYEIIVKNYKQIIFYENEKIEKIIYYGSDEFRNGKKEQEFYKNGKLKQEGVVNQYRKEYDINGKLIRSSSQFNSLWDGVH
jgi:hypothetical protein